MSQLPESTATRAIVLCCFGSVVGFSRLLELQAQLQKQFSDARLMLAITSRTILKRLTAQGQTVATLAQCLAELEREGIDKVVVANCFLFPTEEYCRAGQVVAGFQQFSATDIKPTSALLQTPASAELVCNSLLQRYPADSDTVNLFLTHGTANPQHPGYRALHYVEQFLLQRHPQHLCCSLEGPFAFELVAESLIATLQSKLAASDTPRIRLVPLLLVAGNHFMKDLQAIRSQLEPYADVALAEPVSGAHFCLLDLPEIEQLLVEAIQQQLAQLESL